MTSASSDLLWLRICCLPLREAASAVVCCVTFSMSQSCRGHLPRIPTVLYQRASPAVFILFIARPQLQEAPRRRQRQRSKSSENFVEREHEPAHDSWAPTRAAAEFLLRSFFFFLFLFFLLFYLLPPRFIVNLRASYSLPIAMHITPTRCVRADPDRGGKTARKRIREAACFEMGIIREFADVGRCSEPSIASPSTGAAQDQEEGGGGREEMRRRKT